MMTEEVTRLLVYRLSLVWEREEKGYRPLPYPLGSGCDESPLTSPNILDFQVIVIWFSPLRGQLCILGKLLMSQPQFTHGETRCSSHLPPEVGRFRAASGAQEAAVTHVTSPVPWPQVLTMWVPSSNPYRLLLASASPSLRLPEPFFPLLLLAPSLPKKACLCLSLKSLWGPCGQEMTGWKIQWHGTEEPEPGSQ